MPSSLTLVTRVGTGLPMSALELGGRKVESAQGADSEPRVVLQKVASEGS